MNDLLYHTNKNNVYNSFDYLKLSTDGVNLNSFHNNISDYTLYQSREGLNGRPFDQIFKQYPTAVSRPELNYDDGKTSLLYLKTMNTYKDISGYSIPNKNIPLPSIKASKQQAILGLVM